jgi:UDP-GlcNAc:undecaprenyl-phosphate GlcNAc-1-phosphate transferase
MQHLLFFGFTFVFSYLINGLFVKFSGTLGTKNSKGGGAVIRWGATSKPAFGGISFYIVFLVSFALYTSFFAEEAVIQSFFGVLIATSLGFLIGLADDAYNTRPVLKFFGQVACGVILVFTDNCINIFDIEFLNQALTVLWVVGMMNSINMLDNMDAITTVVSIGVIIGALLILAFEGAYNHFYFWLLTGVLASLLGFIRFNWHPSKMYMGDTGSQFLGVFLAAIGIYFFWNDFSNTSDGWFASSILPLLMFLPSIVDTIIVVINRLTKKQSPFIGGKDHTTHHMSYMGLKDDKVAIVFFLFSLFSVAVALLVNNYLKEWTGAAKIATLLYCLAVFVVLFWITKVKEEKETR